MREREEFIRDFNEAFAKNDLDFILDSMTEDIEWNLVGEEITKGKAAVKEFMKPMEKVETLELELDKIVNGEESAAAYGRMKIKEPSGEVKSFGFADFYELEGKTNPKISKMTSFVVKEKDNRS